MALSLEEKKLRVERYIKEEMLEKEASQLVELQEKDGILKGKEFRTFLSLSDILGTLRVLKAGFRMSEEEDLEDASSYGM
jgi:hypothetical protein